MTYNDLKTKSLKELATLDKSLREELFHLRLKHKTGQLEKKNRILEVRRDIARIKTKMAALKKESKTA